MLRFFTFKGFTAVLGDKSGKLLGICRFLSEKINKLKLIKKTLRIIADFVLIEHTTTSNFTQKPKKISVEILTVSCLLLRYTECQRLVLDAINCRNMYFLLWSF